MKPLLNESLEDYKERVKKEYRLIYYDREGNAMNLEEFTQKMQTKGEEYRIVKQEYIGRYWVSTVWLGINMNLFRQGPPQIFETMVFVDEAAKIEDDPLEGLQERYTTEQEALRGHQGAVILCENQLKLEKENGITY